MELFENHDINKLVLDNPILFNIEIIILFLILLIGYRKPHNSKEFLSFKSTDSIKGFAILLIIVHHLSRHAISNIEDLKLYHNVGYIGVALFLFLSGYGLTESFQKKGFNDYFQSKVSKVYIPFIVLNVLWTILNFKLLKNELSGNQIFCNIIGINIIDRNYWFIPIILFHYVIFYFSLYYSSEKKAVIFLNFLFSILLLSLSTENFQGIIKINSFSFLFGIIMSYYKHEIDLKISQLNIVKTILLVSILGVGVIYYNPYYPFSINYIFNLILILAIVFLIAGSYKEKLAFVLLSLPIIAFFSETHFSMFLGISLRSVVSVFCIILLFKKIFQTKYPVLLAYIGSVSFELYLLHGAFMYSYDFILFRFPLYISFFVYLLILVFISHTLNRYVFNINKIFKLSYFLQLGSNK